MSNRNDDRWLLPRRQTEYPARDLVSEATLHGRREATFLALSTMFVVTITSLVLLGMTRMIDVSALLPQLDLPLHLVLPLGVVPSALAFFAVMLACELYGRRRAAALLVAGVIAMAAMVGLVRLANASAFAPAVALAAGVAVGQLASLLAFDALRRGMAGRHAAGRAVVASLIAVPLGWAAFGLVLQVQTGADLEWVTTLALGPAVFQLACMIVLALPLSLAARAFALFLRVARGGDDKRAIVVEDAPVRRRAPRATIQPFSSAEMRFFTEGDQLSEG